MDLKEEYYKEAENSLPLQMSDFDFWYDEIESGTRRSIIKTYYLNYKKQYDGTIGFGPGDNVQIEWDDETPENWEDIEIFIDRNLHQIEKIAEKI